MAEFTVSFDVQGSSPEQYEAFIKDLRKRLADSFLHNLLPVLPQQDPRSYFHVVLQTQNGQITLRIERGSLYLVGYRMESTGTWWNFKSAGKIDGSSSLGFDGGYNSLENAAGVSSVTREIAGVNLSKRNVITLGQYPLIGAVNGLDTLLPEGDKDNDDKKKAVIKKAHEKRAQFLIVVIRMICESIRFTPISDYIVTHYTMDSGFNLEQRMMVLEGVWGKLSDNFRAVTFQPCQLQNWAKIESVEQAATILAIVKGLAAAAFVATCSKHINKKRPGRDVDYGQCLHGRPLAEVFSVRINDIDGQEEDNLYGNITITDGLGSQNIFKDGEFIHKGKNACLIGPARSISADDSFTINLDLKDHYRFLVLFPREHEVSHGQISWNVYNTTNEYDKLLSKEVRSQYGLVTVNYAVLSDAVEATVEVTLEGEIAAKIYEWITASNGVSESDLFRKAEEEHIFVKPGETIPLSRSVVAVPLNSALIVSAKLWQHPPFSSIFSSSEIVNDTARFPAQLSGAFEKKLSGEYGAIKVKVTWNK